jgi:hypothetical protein
MSMLTLARGLLTVTRSGRGLVVSARRQRAGPVISKRASKPSPVSAQVCNVRSASDNAASAVSRRSSPGTDKASDQISSQRTTKSEAQRKRVSRRMRRSSS